MPKSSPTFLDPQVLARIEGLAFRAKAIVEGYVAGMHRSPYHGFSVEFAEHREYAPGDDLRYVDWKVFGRTDKFYLKQFEEETNLTCHLVLDCSASMRYGSPEAALNKLDYARCVTAALAYLILRQQDRVGLQTCGSGGQQVRPSAQGSQWSDLLQVLEETPAEGHAQLSATLSDLAERNSRRGVVVAVSDFLDELDSLSMALKYLRHRRNDVLLIQVLDPLELEFDFRRTTLFRGLEIPRRLLVDPHAVRKAYRAELDRHLRMLEATCRASRVDYLRMLTNQPPGTVLARYVAGRAAAGKH